VVGAELDRQPGLVGAPQPYPSIAAAGDDATVGERRHCSDRSIRSKAAPVVGAELDWNVGLVGALQPHPSIAAAGDDAIVEQNGNRRHCAVLAAELGWNAGLVSAPPAARGRARFL
jgi:hypothetical protein